MASKLHSNFSVPSQTASQVLESRGKHLHSGFIDEIDAEAMRAANAISRANGLRPRKPRRAPVTLNAQRLREMPYETVEIETVEAA